jgi:hypothetical protein
MYVPVIHRDSRPWPRPGNHFDGRVCPDCGTTVHGSKAQARHRGWHLQLNTLATELAKRTGITETPFGVPWRWGADVEGQSADLEEAAE